MANFALSTTTSGARKHAWTNKFSIMTLRPFLILCVSPVHLLFDVHVGNTLLIFSLIIFDIPPSIINQLLSFWRKKTRMVKLILYKVITMWFQHFETFI